MASATVRNSLLKTLSQITSALKGMLQFIGRIFILLGESMARYNHKYRLVCTIIAEIIRSQDIMVRVDSVYEKTLTVGFALKILKSPRVALDPDYFLRELVLQLGCELSDVDIAFKDRFYYVEITKTALNNLERGTTPFRPRMYYKSEDEAAPMVPDFEEQPKSRKLVN